MGKGTRAPAELPSIEHLHRIFYYVPETGTLHWKVKPRYGIEVGDEVGCVSKESGYRLVGISFSILRSHRVVWAMYFCRWPKGHLDHINRQRTDNRIVNLREATNTENCRNSRMKANNTSGFKGVDWLKKHKKWRATIRVDRKQYHLGLFDTPEEAHAAYCTAADAWHGEFAHH